MLLFPFITVMALSFLSPYCLATCGSGRIHFPGRNTLSITPFLILACQRIVRLQRADIYGIIEQLPSTLVVPFAYIMVSVQILHNRQNVGLHIREQLFRFRSDMLLVDHFNFSLRRGELVKASDA